MIRHLVILFFLILASQSNAQSNSYLHLDGVDDFMEVIDHADLDIDASESFTLTLWIKTSTTGDYYRFLDKRESFGGTGYELFRRNSNGNFGLNLTSTAGVGSGPPYSTSNMADGNWHHVAFVIDRVSAASKIYLDGVLEGTKTLASISTASFASSSNLVIGKESSGDQLYFTGSIDDLRIWSKVMTSSNLISDMSSTIDGSESNLLAAWDFENVAGTSVTDISGKGHTGTLYGGAEIIDPNTPMTFSSLALNPQITFPVGRGNQDERVVSVNIQTIGDINPISVSDLNLTLAGTEEGNISNIKVYYTGSYPGLETSNLFGSALPSSGNIVISGSQSLKNGANNFWITYDISNSATEGDFIDVSIESANVGGNVEVPPTTNVTGSRLILLEHNWLWADGDNGASRYRIPGITTSLDGTLIAAIDKRWSSGDINDNTNIDIAVKRSTDGGKTWSDEIIVADFGLVNGVNEGASDPAIITDRNTGDIITLYLGYNGIFGSSPSNRARVFMSRSSDDGLSWDAPKDISDDVYPEGWYMSWVASGSFSQTKSGRLIAVVSSRQSSAYTMSNHLIYSDDGGYNWSIEQATPSTADGDESKVVELANGDLLMNMRRSGGYRYISKSSDGGKSWTPQAQDTELEDPRNNADLIRYTSVHEGFDKNRILFSNARTTNSPRRNIHVYLSHDEGESWPVETRKQIYAGEADYSTLTVLDNGDIGIVYETREGGGFQIAYARLSLDWLTSGTDTYVVPSPPAAASSLSAADIGVGVQLSWTDNSSTESGFEIYRSETTGSDYDLIGRVATDVDSYLDNSLLIGDSTYYYLVKAYNPGGSSNGTNEASVVASSTPVAILSTFPKDFQLYARGSDNKAKVTIEGSSKNIDSYITKVISSGEVLDSIVTDAQTSFSFEIEIDAGFHDYTVEFYLKTSDGNVSLVQSAANVTAGDVYVIHGQSNAWAIDYDNAYDDEDLPAKAHWIRTVGAMHVYNSAAIEPAASDTDWYLARGKAPDSPSGEYVGAGMVGVLGINIGLNLVESEDMPIAIINGAGGGGAISAYQKTSDNDLDAPYGRLQFRLENSGLKDNIKAFIWNQGENNAGYAVPSYKAALEMLYTSLSSDLTFEKFYLIQTPPACNSSGHETVREAQRQFAIETANTHILTRHGFPPDPTQGDGNYFLSDGCHYHAHGYEVLADWISSLAQFHFYNGSLNYEAPQLVRVEYESTSSIIIKFDKEVAIQPDLLVDGVTYALKDYAFAVNDTLATSISDIALVSGDARQIRLSFSGQTIDPGDVLTYILGDKYPSGSSTYIGPWIVDAATGVGAVGFSSKILESLPYCDPGSMTASTAVFIDYLKLSTSPAFNVPSDNEGYLDNTAYVIEMTPGNNYTFNIGAGNPGVIAAKRIDIWIDYNQDGDFDDNGELILGWGSDSYTSEDLQFSNRTIPETALPGESRMRVALKATNSASSPCIGFTNGEIEDYTVNFTAPKPASAYCEPVSMAPSTDVFIDYVKINSSPIFDIPSANTGYEDNTEYIVEMIPGNFYTFNIGAGNPDYSISKRLDVWLDYNQDGDFNDADELFLAWGSDSHISADLQFTNKQVSANAILGTTRMRVALKATNSASAPCDIFTDGEVEDYMVKFSEEQSSNVIQDEVLAASIYPVPAKDYLNISIEEAPNKSTEYEIFNIIGKRVASSTSSGTVIKIDVSNWSDGIYILRLKAGSKTSSIKFVKI